jgi:hypothetical protein
VTCRLGKGKSVTFFYSAPPAVKKKQNRCLPSCLDVTDEHSEDEDAHEPGRRHEDDLRDVVLRRLRVLPNRDGRLGGEIEAPKTMFKKMLQKNTKIKKDGKQYLFMKCA